MSKKLSASMRTLVDKTESLGAGIVDSSGLMISSYGFHAEKDKEELAAFLIGMSPKGLNKALDDVVNEYIIMANKFKIYCYWLDSEASILLYVICKQNARGQLVRTELHATAANLKAELLNDSLVAEGQRLKQPRHMSGDRWPAQDFENILK